MPSLANVLADIPFAGGYYASQDRRERQGAQQLQQVGLLAQLQAQMVGAQEKQRAAAKLQAFETARAQLGRNATPEQLVALASQHVGPDDLYKIGTASQDRAATRDNTRQIAMQRLGQQIATEARHAYEFAQTLPITERRAALSEINSRSQKAYQAGQLAIAAGNLNYNTGADVGGIGDIVSQLRSASQATAPSSPALQADVQGSAPTDQSALRMVQDAASRGQTASVYGPAASAPAQAPVSPAPAASIPGATPGDFNQRPGIPAAAQPGAPAAAVMPQFSGSPRQIAEAQNRWRAAQGKLDINLAGGRESTFINRVVMSGNQAAADLANVVQLPMTASRGLFGGRGQGKSLFEAGKETLTTAMTTQEVQTYNVMATGFQRALAAIEGAGLAPTNALMHQMDAVIFKEGDTNFTKLMKLAQTRQIVEKGLETIMANPRVPKLTKDHVEEIVAKITKSVPFTASDLMELQKQQALNPNATLGDVVGMKARTRASDSNPTWTDNKEQRYQELLRKQRGGS